MLSLLLIFIVLCLVIATTFFPNNFGLGIILSPLLVYIIGGTIVNLLSKEFINFIKSTKDYINKKD